MNESHKRRAADPLRATYSNANVDLRVASPEDKRAALRIDDGYTTSAMWQMYDHASALSLSIMNSESLDRADAGFGVAFLPVRLPRPRRVEGLRSSFSPLHRASTWDAAGCVLVAAPHAPRPIPEDLAALPGADPAEPKPPAPRQIWGFAVISAVPQRKIAWLSEFCVAEEHRRHGLGAMLLGGVLAWAGAPESYGGAGGLQALMVELAPRNSPAISFCRAHGFTFCGYTDYSSVGGDTTLLFSRGVV